ncbi:MAG: UvrD-helicase domain-containing protein, partial [Candidatus Paceibacterota bacterium]
MFKVKPSEEQHKIIQTIIQGRNCVVDAVAGSGKTTTVLLLAIACPNQKILQLTYNKDLKLDVREKARYYGIKNLEVQNFNSLIVNYYDRNGSTDKSMRTVIATNAKPFREIPKYDIIVVDETQDMKELYFELINKLKLDMKQTPKMPTYLIMGDHNQAIYEFMQADLRYLTCGHRIYSSLPFDKLTLSYSYRLTKEISSFVNDIMLNEDRIHTKKKGPPVMYIHSSPYSKGTDIIFKELMSLLISKKIKADDIFVLCGSIKAATSPIRKLEQKLVQQGVKCCIPLNDDQKIDADIMKGKVLFCTIHQAKGLERKVVIIYGFDNSYFEYHARDKPSSSCPNELYVACTRASERLILLHDNNQEMLPFLTDSIFESGAKIDFYGSPIKEETLQVKENGKVKGKIKGVSTNFSTSVTELTKYLKEEILSHICELLNDIFVTVSKEENVIKIPTKIMHSNGTCEDVSDINGLAIPSM